mgnify:FL=1
MIPSQWRYVWLWCNDFQFAICNQAQETFILQNTYLYNITLRTLCITQYFFTIWSFYYITYAMRSQYWHYGHWLATKRACFFFIKVQKDRFDSRKRPSRFMQKAALTHLFKPIILVSRLHLQVTNFWNFRLFAHLSNIYTVSQRCALDTIEDYRTQIRRVWLVDLTILSNFHIKTSSLWSVSDYECHLLVFGRFLTSFDNRLPFWYLFFITFTITWSQPAVFSREIFLHISPYSV